MQRFSSSFVSRLGLALLVPALLVVGAGHSASGQGAEKEKAKARSPLDGAWRLISMKDPRSGEQRKVPETIEMTKLVVDGRYSWTIARGEKILASAGGSYSVKDETYTENVVFTVGENQQVMAGKSFKFSWKIEDGKWHHKGTLKIGEKEQEIDEIWERVR